MRANRGTGHYGRFMSTIESEILTRVIAPEDPSYGQEAAEAVLALGFKETDKRRTEELAEKARLGTLSEAEQSEADSYERIGYFVSLLKSKARRSLQTA